MILLLHVHLILLLPLYHSLPLLLQQILLLLRIILLLMQLLSVRLVTEHWKVG